MVFFFLYGLVRVLPISLFRRMAGPFLHVFIRFAIPRKRVIRNLSAFLVGATQGLLRTVWPEEFRNIFFETYSIACCNLPTINTR